MLAKTMIIAEAGVNHNGSLDRALRLIDAAKDAGADSVKFQTFKSEAVISRNALKAEYQNKTTDASETQLEMVKKLELDERAHQELVAHCATRKIQFLSTPFDLASVEFLAAELKVDMLKVPSGEVTNFPLLLKVARTGKPVLLSTGMSSLGEIEDALAVLAFGFTPSSTPDGLTSFREAFESSEGQRLLRSKVTLLHCTTEYPAPFEDVNLAAMETMKAAFGLPVGYSDHTPGIAVSLAAVARGAVIIEKHFTLDRNLPGPDHKASLEPHELREMVLGVRQVEACIGSPLKISAPSERKNRSVARKSLVAAVSIRAGDSFSLENLTCKRPGNGISPTRYWEFVGRTADRNYEVDDFIRES